MKLLLVFATLLVAAPLSAQNGVPSPQGWSLTVMGGGAAFTDFQRSTVQAVGVSRSGGPEQRDFPRRVSAKTAGSLAAAISYWPTPNWGIRLFGSYAASRFETMIAESDAEFMDVPRSSEETGALAPLSIISYDAQAVFRLPTVRQRLMPYAFLGGGIVRYDITAGGDPVPDEAHPDFTSGGQTRPAARLGIGARLPFRRAGWGLSFELNDQIAGTPIPRGGDQSVRVTHALGFMVGVNVGL
jgi:hypothetical protein